MRFLWVLADVFDAATQIFIVVFRASDSSSWVREVAGQDDDSSRLLLVECSFTLCVCMFERNRRPIRRWDDLHCKAQRHASLPKYDTYIDCTQRLRRV